MMTIEDEKLMAYLDGELSPEEMKQIDDALETDHELRALLDSQRRLKARLIAHFAPTAEEPIPDRFKTLLESEPAEEEAERSSEIVDFVTARRDRETRRNSFGGWGLPQLSAIAASLAIGLVAGPTIFGGWEEGSATITEGIVLAAGDPLTSTLDTQLASTQASDAPIRVGITFLDQQGNYCRTFDGPKIDGIACRQDGAWQLAIAVSGAESTADPQFRQAASGNRIVLEYAQSIMAGAPVEAGAEQQARDGDWSR